MASSDLLTKLEKDRLKNLNDRTVCISPNKLDRLPNNNVLRAMGFSFQSIMYVARAHQIFIIFEDLGKSLSLNQFYLFLNCPLSFRF